MLKLFNTYGRKKQTFKPIKKGEVGMYSCGPTVYWFQHIGNLRTYIFNDILKRVLTYDGFKVKQVINITDVGHLTSDADIGEDKMETAAIKEGKKASEIAQYYFDVFNEDLKKLNIIEPNIWAKATDNIKEQIEMIVILEKKGYTYKTPDGIYFDTSKFKDYGKMAKLNLEGLEGGRRVELGDKKNKTDFALWKFSEKVGVRQQEWESPWGKGFPGWHIECSAMGSKYLGKQFDIHTGGEDHIPIHHTNEIAQSESAYEKKPWVKYWIHGAFLKFGGEKMSKSKGKIETISDLEKKGYSALDYRYFLLTAHYRTQLNYSLNSLDAAKTSRKRLRNIISGWEDDGKVNEKYLNEFETAIDNDLDIPSALVVLWRLVRDENAFGKVRTVKSMEKVFGLDLFKGEEEKIPAEILEIVKAREKARNDKDWKLADKLRDKIAKKGFRVDDTGDGSKLQKI
jgi:cysteinyl-tRNA synthetase